MQRSQCQSIVNLTIPNPFEMILQRLERIETLLGAVPGRTLYTTKSPPPGMSRRRFNEVCRELFARGDRRVSKVGRGWTAERGAIDVHARAESKVVRLEPWSPEGALAAAGLRPQRGVA